MLDQKFSYNYIVLGDSISKGIIYDEIRKKYLVLQDNYVDIVKTKIKGEVFNVARFGGTISKGANRLKKEIRETNPDIVLIEFGGNDCDFNWAEVAQNPFENHKPKTDINTFSQLLYEVISTTKKNGATPVLLNMPPLEPDRYLNWISKNDPEMKKNILIFLDGSSCKIYWWHERYNSAIINIAQETNTRLIDIRGAFLEKEDYRPYVCLDGIHPNVFGHQLIADKVLKYIQSGYSYLLKE